ncbi:MAG: TRAP transporter fused permease subunit [Xanthobacteraceae bacterium]|nr:TRAP transporter fused permease subunit [Xanthobacteraceae bacterium]
MAKKKAVSSASKTKKKAAADKPAKYASQGNPPTTTVVDDVSGHLDLSWGHGWLGSLIFYIAIAFSIFQIVTSFGIPLDKPFFTSLPRLKIGFAAPQIDVLLLIRLTLLAWAAWLIRKALKKTITFADLFGFVAVFGAIELVAAFAGGMPSQVVRALHVGFLTLLASAMIANPIKNLPLKLAMWGIGIAGFLIGLYQWQFYLPLIDRSGFLTEFDIIIGTASLAILLFLVQRVMGTAITAVTGTFLLYCLFGHLLPAPLDHRAFSYDQVIEHMAYGTEGIYGVPTLVSATYIFLFILFGSFMERAGVINYFNDISMAAFGRSQGGPGKVCIASSALMGTVSGSGIANVVASGQFTIPLMKRFGFPAAYAGGVEATSSMGGQIMPPVMGAVAFIMAETIDRPYSEIVQAAIIPALLYFGATYLSVHFEAGRRGLRGLPGSELPNAWEETKKKWFLILPLLVLVLLLFTGFTPLFAGAVGLALTAVLILATPVAEEIRGSPLKAGIYLVSAVFAAWALWTSGQYFSSLRAGTVEDSGFTAIAIEIGRVIVAVALFGIILLGLSRSYRTGNQYARVAFWIALGALTAVALERSVAYVLAILAGMILWGAFYTRGREALLACRDAMADGARQALSVGLACAAVGMVIGTMTLTGLGTIFGTWLISIGKESLFLALILTMIFSLILGMGIPTIPNYIITSSLAAPILLKLGVPLIVSHMFVFYFGIMADLTPPVALAAFAAAPMARVSGFQVAYKAVLIALPGFIVPYLAVYDPSLMLQPIKDASGAAIVGLPYWIDVVYVVAKASFAMLLWAATAIGFIRGPVSYLERAWAFFAAVFLVAALPVTDEIGWALGLSFIGYHYWKYWKPVEKPAARTKTA